MGGNYLSFTMAVILQALDSGYRYGFDVMDVTGLASGTVYPALRRLEQLGLVASSWEREDAARREQRPARKYYELSPDGRAALGEALKRYRLLDRGAAPSRREPEPEQG